MRRFFSRAYDRGRVSRVRHVRMDMSYSTADFLVWLCFWTWNRETGGCQKRITFSLRLKSIQKWARIIMRPSLTVPHDMESFWKGRKNKETILTVCRRWYKGCTTYCCLAKKHFVNACIKASCTWMLERARIVRLELSFSMSYISFSDIHFSFL